MTMSTDEMSRHYTGHAGCPTCNGGDGMVNVGRGHLAYCLRHRVTWWIGHNLFSGWQDESEDEQRARFDGLGLGEFDEH